MFDNHYMYTDFHSGGTIVAYQRVRRQSTIISLITRKAKTLIFPQFFRLMYRPITLRADLHFATIIKPIDYRLSDNITTYSGYCLTY